MTQQSRIKLILKCVWLMMAVKKMRRSLNGTHSSVAGAKAVGFEAGRNNDVGRNETQNEVLKLCSDKPRSDNHGRNISFVEIWPGMCYVGIWSANILCRT